MKDDSGGGDEYRATMERENDAGQITGLEKRRLCWRGIGGEGRLSVKEGEEVLNHYWPPMNANRKAGKG